MPVENEDKFVLGLDGAGVLRDRLGALHSGRLIDQIYLNPQVRYRRIRDLGRPTAPPEYEFTFKQLIEGRLLEQPCAATAEDFELASLAKTSFVHKARFSFPDGSPGAHWDVDFLLDAPAEKGGRLVFAMAECEYPEGGSHGMPDILAAHVVLAVPREHSHLFSNARLSEPGYAATLLERYRDGWRG
jgi:hypothetical protein